MNYFSIENWWNRYTVRWINRTLIRLRLEDFWKGMNFRLVTVWKSNFLARLTRLRKNTLSEIGSPGLVGLAPGYVSGKPG
jgi:hypothetical protein